MGWRNQRASKAQRQGKEAEDFIDLMCKYQRIFFIKHLANVVWTRGGGYIPKKSPFDRTWFSTTGRCALVDIKSTDDPYFSYSKVNFDQVNILDAAKEHVSESENLRTGYVVVFRKSNVIVFFTAKQLINLKPEQSLKPEEGLYLGTTFDPHLKLIFGEVAESKKN